MRNGTQNRFRVGTAGWSVPRQHAELAAGEGAHLDRYARVFDCAEINSRFYRPHKPETWLRWAASVPADFRFAVKMAKAITHEAKLQCGQDALREFFAEIGALGEKLGPVLVQLPPKLEFAESVARGFFGMLREEFAGAVALEPRNASWFVDDVSAMLRAFRIARVAADPAKPKTVDAAAEPGGWDGLMYFRLHGSPRMYYSGYGEDFLKRVVARMKASSGEAWCVFDNTAAGAAFGDALKLKEMLEG